MWMIGALFTIGLIVVDTEDIIEDYGKQWTLILLVASIFLWPVLLGVYIGTIVKNNF